MDELSVTVYRVLCGAWLWGMANHWVLFLRSLVG
jgi:hypothetical protein